MRDQNGLDPRQVWENIRLTIAMFVLEARAELSCHVNPVPHACGTAGFHFFADLVVDSLGRAWLMTRQNKKLLQTLTLEDGDPLALKIDILVLQGRAYFGEQHYAIPTIA